MAFAVVVKFETDCLSLYSTEPVGDFAHPTNEYVALAEFVPLVPPSAS